MFRQTDLRSTPVQSSDEAAMISPQQELLSVATVCECVFITAMRGNCSVIAG